MAVIEQKLAELLDCVCEALKNDGAGPVCYCALFPGFAPPREMCGECSDDVCGMAYVQMPNTWKYQAWPIPSQDGSPCNAMDGYTINIGVMRCMPVGDSQGEPPPPDIITETALITLADRRALQCVPKRCGFKYVVTQGWQALGPQGGCVGGEWSFLVNLDG